MATQRIPRPAKTAPTSGPFYRGNAYRIEDSVGHLVRLLLVSMNRRIDTRMQPHDLTALQWKPLLMLKFGLANTAAELARQNDSDTGAMTRMIDRLETKGLLQRTRSEHDRRVVHLELTADGRKAADQVPFELSEVLNEHLAGFTQKEFEQLLSLLRRMIDNGVQAAAADANTAEVSAGAADTRGASTDHASTNRSRTGSKR